MVCTNEPKQSNGQTQAGDSVVTWFDSSESWDCGSGLKRGRWTDEIFRRQSQYNLMIWEDVLYVGAMGSNDKKHGL